MNEKASARMAATARSKPDEDLLDLFPEEQKTATSPSSFGAMLATTKSETAIEDTLHSLISWLTSRLQRSGAYASLGVVTPTLGVLMSTTKEARRAFVQSGGIGYISRHLRAKRPRLPPSTNTQTPQKKLGRPSNASGSSRQSALQPASVLLSEKPPSPVRHRKKKDASSFVVTNPFNSSASPDPMVGRSGSFGSIGSSVSSNVDRLDILQSLPSTEDVEKNLDSMFFTASEAAAAIARSAPSGLASLAAATMTEAAPPSSPKAKSAVASSSVQQLYDLVFCLWCLSLDCSADESVRKHFSRDGAIPALAHLLKKVPREKVLRVTLACLRSLSTLSDGSQSKHEQPFVRDMIGCAVLKSLETVKQRRWNDADLEEDLEFLRGFLKDCTQELTQWSAYEAQIATGILRWDDMLHTHDFLRANARHMEGSKADFAPLKRLVEVLYSNTTSGKLRRSGRADEISYLGLNEVGGWDEDDLKDDEICETLAVCLFDIGEFARNYPNGKAVLSSRCGIGAKALIMQYVHHPRDEVREQALLCASKIMVRNWRVSLLEL
jgi:V-type H+-transporting ATPase subunit H